MDAATRGLLIHELLRSVSIELHEQGLFSPDTDLLHAKRVLLAAVNRAAASYRDELAPAIPRVWDDAISDIAADLVRWLQVTRESGWQPVHFEHEFGRRPSQASAAQAAGPVMLPFGLPLQGVIDAIEQSGDSAARDRLQNRHAARDQRRGRRRATLATHALCLGHRAALSRAPSDRRQCLLLHHEGTILAQRSRARRARARCGGRRASDHPKRLPTGLLPGGPCRKSLRILRFSPTLWPLRARASRAQDRSSARAACSNCEPCHERARRRARSRNHRHRARSRRWSSKPPRAPAKRPP